MARVLGLELSRTSGTPSNPSKEREKQQTPLTLEGARLVYEDRAEDATKPDIVPAPLRFEDESSGSCPFDRYSKTAYAAYTDWPDMRLGYLERRGSAAEAVLLHPLRSDRAQSGPNASSDALLERRIHHALVIPVIDLICLEGEPMLAMEYVAGVTLATLQREGGPFRPSIALAIAVDLLRALEAGHRSTSHRGEPLGLAHGGLTPREILVDTDGRPRLVDFGLVRTSRRASSERDSRSCGYLAPEHVFECQLDRRTDVFLVGVVLWNALTGYSLLGGDNPVERLMKFMTVGCDPPSRFNAEVPHNLDRVIARALDPSPDGRFQNASVFCDALTSTLRPASAADVSAFVGVVASATLKEQSAWLRRASEPPPASGTRNKLVQRFGPRVETAAPLRSLMLPDTRDEPTVVDGAPVSRTVLAPSPPAEVVAIEDSTARPPQVLPDRRDSDHMPPLVPAMARNEWTRGRTLVVVCAVSQILAAAFAIGWSVSERSAGKPVIDAVSTQAPIRPPATNPAPRAPASVTATPTEPSAAAAAAATTSDVPVVRIEDLPVSKKDRRVKKAPGKRGGARLRPAPRGTR
jgi:serine/threonine protein kinase